ncbi:DUF1189 family protein [Brevibacillus daliensis]|uniref:DUF1189 family protein n=1 Tax=Brevibacillus daliensis TaxID=2892995 RepID=UPI001E2916BD|nr:DUF1189 family protein [Brevibacillus daliensis]
MLQSFVTSLIRPNQIFQLINKGMKKAVFYLLLLCLLLSLFSFARFFMTTTFFLNEAGPFVSQLPPFVVENGQLKMEADQPIFSDDKVFVVDPNNQLTPADYPNVSHGFIFTKDKIVSTVDGVSTGEITYTMANFAPGKTIDNEYVTYLVTGFFDSAIIIWTLVFIAIYIYTFSSLLIMATFSGVLAFVLGMITKKNLQFGSSWSLAVYCITAPTLVQTILLFMGASLPINAITWGLIGVYVTLAVRGMKDENQINQKNQKPTRKK